MQYEKSVIAKLFMLDSTYTRISYLQSRACLIEGLLFVEKSVFYILVTYPDISLISFSYNHKSDMWSLGCVLYELSTHKQPFQASEFSMLIVEILHAKYKPIPR